VLCGGLLAPVLLLEALALAPAGSVALWLNLEGVATALLAWLFFREHLGARSVLAIALVVGALCYGLSLVLLVAAAQQLGAARSQLAFATASLWGVALAWLWLGEPVHPAQLAAGTVMGVALVLLRKEPHSHWHQHPEVTHRHWHRHDDEHHRHAHAPGDAAEAHSHEHRHAAHAHAHPHRPDLRHRHAHRGGHRS
jgi:drug/metabolite transporter (DMT)-like permease